MVSLSPILAHAQPSGRDVIVYDETGSRGRGEALTGDWGGGGNWDRPIRSVRVPAGMRVMLYREPSFQGAETRLMSDWSPTSSGAYWDQRARSARVTRNEPPPPSSAASDAGPTAYTQGRYEGRLIGIKKNFHSASISSPYAVIRSLRVPLDWEVRTYDFTSYWKPARVFTSDWLGSGPAIRSYRLR